MTEKDYKRSTLWQAIASVCILALVIKGFFYDYRIGDAIFIIFWVGIDIVETIKQQFYNLKNEDKS